MKRNQANLDMTLTRSTSIWSTTDASATCRRIGSSECRLYFAPARFSEVRKDLYLCLCVYVYVYKHVCMYICMYACMHACMHVCMYVYMYVCMHACMDARMYVCVYMYIYIYITHLLLHLHLSPQFLGRPQGCGFWRWAQNLG